MRRKRVIGLISLLLLLFGLTACGESRKSITSEPIVREQPIAVTEEGQWTGKGGCYKLERISENDYSSMKGSAEQYVYSGLDKLYDKNGNIIFNDFAVSYVVQDDVIYCAVESYPADMNQKPEFSIVKQSYAGKELARYRLPSRADYIAISNGTILTYDIIENELAVYDSEGTKQGCIDLSGAKLEDFSERLCTGSDGSAWLQSDIDNTIYLYPINIENKNLGAQYELPKGTLGVFGGNSEHALMISTTEELAYVDPLSNTKTNILYWEECGLSSSELDDFIPDGDGILCLSVTGLSRISPAKPEEIHKRIRLTLGSVMRWDGSSELAAMFNAMSNDYYVEIIDYSNNGELNMEDALLKLNTEVTGSNGPDMVMNLDLSSLQTTSVYADLYPLLDADTEVSRNDFYGLKAMESGERMLFAPSSFAISTFYSTSEIAKNRIGWTWEEYFEQEDKLPAGGVMSSYLSGDFFLESSLNLYVPHAVDWVNGTCNFDTPEFVKILEAAKRGYDPNCPEENQYTQDEANTMMSNGQMILESAYFTDVDEFARSEEMGIKNPGYIGWPTPDGSCGSIFQASGISVYESSDCIEGCWEFAKYLLESTYAYKPTFDKAISEALARNPEDNGEHMALTQEQADRYRQLMENITVAASDSSTINTIVSEEASAMFAGSQTPEETAKFIQSRISIYMAENK